MQPQEIHNVAPDFNSQGRDEFSCNCGCGENRISLSFVKRLQAARTIAGISFVIATGARCPKENERVGGVDDSAHVPDFMPDKQSHASDINAETSREKFKIISALLKVGFTRIGVMEDGVHVDSADMIGFKSENLIWDYYQEDE